MDFETAKLMELNVAELLCGAYISKLVRFEILTAVLLRILVFWDMTLSP
jgi:hypothetical protein